MSPSLGASYALILRMALVDIDRFTCTIATVDLHLDQGLNIVACDVRTLFSTVWSCWLWILGGQIWATFACIMCFHVCARSLMNFIGLHVISIVDRSFDQIVNIALYRLQV